MSEYKTVDEILLKVRHGAPYHPFNNSYDIGEAKAALLKVILKSLPELDFTYTNKKNDQWMEGWHEGYKYRSDGVTQAIQKLFGEEGK